MNKLKRSLILLMRRAHSWRFCCSPSFWRLCTHCARNQKWEPFLKTRGLYDPSFWMEVKLEPRLFSLRQYYAILLEDTSVLRLFGKLSHVRARGAGRPSRLHTAHGLCAQPVSLSGQRRDFPLRAHADAAAVSGDDGRQRAHAARDGIDATPSGQ